MEQEVGAGWLEGVHPEDKGCCMDTYLASFERARALKWNTGSSGTTDYGVGSTTAAPTFDAEHRFTGYIGSCMDVTEKVEGRKLIDLAHYDTLTSVFNRNYLEILIDFESQNRKRSSIRSAILIDVDNFLTFNDQYGHDFGDKVALQHAALMSGQAARERLYRPILAGTNFLILLPRTRQAEASGIAQRILDALPMLNIENSLR